MAIIYAEAHLAATKIKVVGPALVRFSHCRHGTMMYFPHDQYIGASLEKYGEYNKDETEFLCNAIVEGSFVVEVGANIGTHTVPMAQKVGKKGHLLVFEPQRVLHHMLCGNLAINALWNVTTERVALGSKKGTSLVPLIDYSEPGNFGSVEMSETEGEPVALMRLDDYPIPALHFLKIDVEGMELEVLKGATELIKKYRPLIYCENDRPWKKAELLAYLRDVLEYDLYGHFPYLFNKQNYRECPDNIFPNIASSNMACIPRERAEEIATNLPKVE